MEAPDDDEGVFGWRLREAERKISGLTEHSVSREWLDERLARITDKIDSVAADVSEIRRTERARRLAVYTALVVGVVSLVSALVMVAMNGSPPPGGL